MKNFLPSNMKNFDIIQKNVDLCYIHILLVILVNKREAKQRLRGATVARLTPDQKVACSNHVGVNKSFIFSFFEFKYKFIYFSTIYLKYLKSRRTVILIY